MQKVVIKRNPYKLSFKEKVLRVLGAIFKERTFIVNREGRLAQYRFTPALQSVIFLVLAGSIGWSAFVTREYIANYDDIKDRAMQVQDARDKFDAAVGELKAYRDMTDNARTRIENLYDKMATKLDRIERDTFMKERVKISAEADYVSGQLNEFVSSRSFNRQDKSDSYRSTRAEFERNLVMTENVVLKKRNAELETSMLDMSELQNSLLDKVQKLAKSGLDDLEKTLSRIDSTLVQVNLKDRNALAAARSKSDSGVGVGGRFIPVKDITLSDPVLNAKFREASKAVHLWEGLSDAKTMLPLGAPIKTEVRVTSHYGVRVDPFEGVPAMHMGIDFGGQVGTPLYSTAPGKVIFAGYRGDYGLTVEISHGLGFSTLYAHLSRISVANGDVVEEGVKVGLAGSSGRSTAPHLHYELRHNGRALNPYAFVSTKR